MIHVSSEPGSNSTIFLATYDQIKNFIEDAYLLFLGKLKNKSYYAIDLSKSNKDFDKTAFPNCKFIDLRSIAQSISPEDTGILAQAKSMVEWNSSNIFVPDVKVPDLKLLMQVAKKFAKIVT